MTTKVK